MVENIILSMYQNTDDNNDLFINGWILEPEKTLSSPRFYKCRMNWDLEKACEIAKQASDICDKIYTLTWYCKHTDADIYTKPNILSVADDDISEEILPVWEIFYGGYDHENITDDELEKLAQQRLGGKVSAYDTFIFAHRIQKALQLDSPKSIVEWEKNNFARSYALTKACEKMVCLDITKDTFDSETQGMGAFDTDDIISVFELINDDCTILPDVEMGCTLFTNRVLGTRRLDIYRCSDALKSAVDELLQTLAKHEREVIEKLYGLKDGVRKSYATAALEMHLPTAAVVHYEAIALRKLRIPFRSIKLEKLFCEPSAQQTGSEMMTELDAFKADKQLADYMERVRKGQLSAEEQENRNALLDFLNSPCELPNEMFDNKGE